MFTDLLKNLVFFILALIRTGFLLHFHKHGRFLRYVSHNDRLGVRSNLQSLFSSHPKRQRDRPVRYEVLGNYRGIQIFYLPCECPRSRLANPHFQQCQRHRHIYNRDKGEKKQTRGKITDLTEKASLLGVMLRYLLIIAFACTLAKRSSKSRCQT